MDSDYGNSFKQMMSTNRGLVKFYDFRSHIVIRGSTESYGRFANDIYQDMRTMMFKQERVLFFGE